MHELLRRLQMLLARGRWRRELAEEMRLHRDLCGSDRQFGNDLRLLERAQAQWGWTWLETWAQDIRHGLRLLRRTPLVTALALLSLALGIGAASALFSLTDAVLLRPLPVSHPDQLVHLTNNLDLSSNDGYPDFSARMFARIRKQHAAFAGVLATAYNFPRQPGSSHRTPTLLVSQDYFATLGLEAERGTLIAASSDHAVCPAIADISDSYWSSRFHRSAGALGSTLRLAGHTFEIVGVTPPGFFGTEVDESFDVAVPLCTASFLLGPDPTWRDTANLTVFARLRPGASLQQAQARLNAVLPRIAAALPADSRTQPASLHIRLHAAANGTSPLRQQQSLALELLLGIAGLVWLLACGNLTALMLARAAAQQPEIAMRLALGASRLRLIRQLLTESILLTLGGVLLAWPLSVWADHIAVRFWTEHGFTPVLNLHPDLRLPSFVAALTLATALLLGLWPALRASDTRLNATAHPDQPRSPLGWRVIIGQLALALVLLAAAGLCARSLAQLTGPAKGFDARHVLLMEYPSRHHATRQTLAPLIAARQAMLGRVGTLPGVTAVAAAVTIPTGGISAWSAVVWPKSDGGRWRGIFQNAVSPGFFKTLRTPLRAGRDFLPSDDGQPVAIINSALVHMLFPGASDGAAIGKSFLAATGDLAERKPWRVIGVASDAKYAVLQRPAPPTLYHPLNGDLWTVATVFVRSPLSPSTLIRELTGILGPGPRATIQPYAALMDQGIKPERMLAALAELFGGLALVLAGLGLYGVVGYNAGRRRREFGIRIALGADRVAIARQVLREAGAALAAALALGGAVAWLLARVLQTELGKALYEVHAQDALTWSGAIAVLCTVATLASLVPACRAARADAMSALREE